MVVLRLGSGVVRHFIVSCPRTLVEGSPSQLPERAARGQEGRGGAGAGAGWRGRSRERT
jgi:hypothetical protein